MPEDTEGIMLRIYKSSAGSGKTYTLVKEFLRIALKDPEKFKHILAITFTNKAANEMKSRIIETLQQISGNTEKVKKLIDDLAAESELDKVAIIEQSGKILRNILHNYSDFSVSTIDSFVHRVIRAFTYDLNLPMTFEIEMDRDKLLTETIELLMDRLTGEEDAVTNAVVEFAESNIEEGKSWNLEHSLIDLGKELFIEDAYPHLEKLETFDLNEAKKIRETLYKFSATFEQKLFEEGKQALSLILNTGLTSQSFFQTNKGVFGFFSKYANEDFPADPLGNSYVQKTISENKWGGGKTTEAELSTIAGIKNQLEQHYKNIAELYSKQGQDYALSKLLKSNFYAFILLADIQRLMEEYKKENNILHISEFQQKVHAIVKEQDAPIIYERIGDWYDSILIDEHQDTSELQWQNLLPLVENSQFKSEDSLVVGDGKQAIYRFRNGKVEQFAVLPKVYGSEKNMRLKEREVAIGNYGTDTQHLVYNFRSRKEIVDFNNMFYDTLYQFPELKNKDIYSEHSQQQGKQLTGGFVSIEFLQDGDESLLEQTRCKRVEQIVRETTTKGYALKDITVLTRSNFNASAVASYLIKRGIPVVSSESLLINNSPKVKLVLSALHYFEEKENHIARATMAYYINLLLFKTAFRFEQFNFKNDENSFEQDISNLLGKEFHSYNFINYQLAELIHQLTLFFNLGDDDPFLQFFMDETISYTSRNRGNIREFLEWWNEVKHKKSIIYPDTLNAVRIMTIHKSKGLEFPVVIMADADWPQKNTKRNFWVTINKPWLNNFNVGILPVRKEVLQTEYAGLYKEEEAASFLDMMNLVYVATTRAEDILYILSTQVAKEPVKKNSVTALLISFLKQQGIWDGFRAYEFGNADTTKLSKAGVDENLRVYDKQKVNQNLKPSRPLTIKKNSQLLWNEQSVEKIDRGNLLHEIMKRIKYADSAHTVLEKMFSEGLIGQPEKQELLNKISALLNNEIIKPYFMPPYKVVNERALMSKQHIKIPDRVVMNGDKAVVIEYKSGKKRNSDTSQLSGYAHELKKFGFTEVKKILIYIEKNQIEEIK